MRRGWLLLGLVGCVTPSYVECPEIGLICPAGSTCDPAHHACVAPDQLAACDGIADGTSCTAGTITGGCRQGACLPFLCGDAVVDPDEMCDDGNIQDGDGCNATCTSTEVCGNGVRDLAEGCDDGNLVAGDGCDSKCGIENETWTIDGVALLYDSPNHTVFDAIRHQVINVTDGATWSWDGATWKLINFGDLPAAWSMLQLVAVPTRQSVVLVGQQSSHTIPDDLWEWSGATWTQIPVTGVTDAMKAPIVAYDSARQVLLAITNTFGPMNLWKFDFATQAWSQLPSPPTVSGGIGFAFDATRNVGVLVAKGAPATVYEWNGTVWSAAKPAGGLPAIDGATIVYDPSQSAVIAVGGGGPTTDIAKWTGTAWAALAGESLPEGRTSPDVTYDSDRKRLVVFGGRSTYPVPDLQTVAELDTATLSWHTSTYEMPTQLDNYGVPSYAYDSHRKELLQLGAPGEDSLATWVWRSGTWHELSVLPGVAKGYAAAAYDPVRDAFVVHTQENGTWLLRDDVWVPAGVPSVPDSLLALTYDPLRGSIIANDGYSIWELPSAATSWTELGAAPTSAFSETLAFDARRSSVLLSSTVTYEFSGGVWTPTLGPGAYVAVADSRRGSVMMVFGQGALWERIDGVWHQLPPLGSPFVASATYAPDTGTLFVIGSLHRCRLMLRRQFVGASPLEACDGTDLDGDGLVDCADPDCFWRCTPQCPPHASCQ